MDTYTFEHVVRNVAHHHFRPIIIGGACTVGNPENPVVVIPAGHECVILPVYIGIVFRFHVTATTPGFITHTPVLYLPWFLSSVLPSQIRHRTLAIKGYVLNPFS